MVTAKGIMKDYNDIVNNKDISEEAKLVKIMRLVLILLTNIRTNTKGVSVEATLEQTSEETAE